MWVTAFSPATRNAQRCSFVLLIAFVHGEKSWDLGGPVETLVLVSSASDFHLLISHSTMVLGHSAASVHPRPGDLTLRIFFGSLDTATGIFARELIVFLSVGPLWFWKGITLSSSGSRQNVLWRKELQIDSSSQCLKSSSAPFHPKIIFIKSMGEPVVRNQLDSRNVYEGILSLWEWVKPLSGLVALKCSLRLWEKRKLLN